MNIDARRLKETILPRIELIADDERFYLLPDDESYAISSYGRLYKQIGARSWHKVPIVYKNGDCYEVNDELIPVHRLLSKVFFNDATYLYCNDYDPWNPRKWDITRLFALTSREDLIETLQAKMEHRESQLDEDKKRHAIVGCVKYDKPINKALRSRYYGMRSRATNPKVKSRYPNYKDATIADEWIEDPQKFYDHILSCQYSYPGKLCVDKDLLAFGESKRYTPENVTLLPLYLNNIFTSDTSRLGFCIQAKVRDDGSVRYVVPQTAYAMRDEKLRDLSFDRYVDALVAGRKRKAEFLRKIVKAEQEAGYIPSYILDAILKWADKCELGYIKIWEPSEEILKEMGLL